MHANSTSILLVLRNNIASGPKSRPRATAGGIMA